MQFVVMDDFLDDEGQEFLGEFGVQIGLSRQIFEPGDLGLPVFEREYGIIGIQICFDAGFPETWQALADLAAFCGVGHKTTMGMGAVELI